MSTDPGSKHHILYRDFAYRDFVEWARQNQPFEGLAGIRWAGAGKTLTGRGDPQNVVARGATENFFSLLGVPAAHDRTFNSTDLNEPHIVVLRH